MGFNLSRVFINQPSCYQPGHEFHGKCGIAAPEDGDSCTVYFTDGPVRSMRVPKLWLSKSLTTNMRR